MTNPEPRAPRTNRWPNSKVGVFVAAVALCGVIAYGAMSFYIVPRNSVEAQETALRQIDEAYRAGDHREVIEIYRNDLDVRFWFDRELYRTEGHINYREMPGFTLVKIGDSYAQFGQYDEADRYYLKALDWSKGQYAAWCRLNEGCQPLAETAKAVMVHPLPTPHGGDQNGNP